MRFSPTGDRYLYFDEPQGAWLVQTELEGGDTAFRAMSTEDRPYYVSAPWKYRAANDYFVSDKIDVECMCGSKSLWWEIVVIYEAV